MCRYSLVYTVIQCVLLTYCVCAGLVGWLVVSTVYVQYPVLQCTSCRINITARSEGPAAWSLNCHIGDEDGIQDYRTAGCDVIMVGAASWWCSMMIHELTRPCITTTTSSSSSSSSDAAAIIAGVKSDAYNLFILQTFTNLVTEPEYQTPGRRFYFMIWHHAHIWLYIHRPTIPTSYLHARPIAIHSFISLISASDKTHSLLQLVRKQVTVHV